MAISKFLCNFVFDNLKHTTMRKIIYCILAMLFITLQSSAHNTHYPTYTENGITYVATSRDSQGNFGGWNVLEVNKPYDKTITIPYTITIDGREEKVNKIMANAFSPCIYLDSLIISDGLYLDEETFIGCKELEYLYYSSNISAWSPYRNKYSFYPNLSCKILETTFGVLEDTFWESIEKSLEKLIIRDISKSIFTRIKDCKNLKTIICYATNPPKTCPTKSVYSYGGTCGYEKFASYQWSTITLYVPRESLDEYYFDGTWGVIDNIYAIEEMETMEELNNTSTFINSLSNNTSKNDEYYSLNGIKTHKPSKGIYVINGKKYIKK